MEALALGLPRDRFHLAWYFLREAGSVGTSLFRRGFDGLERVMPRRFAPVGFGRLVHELRRTRPDVLFVMDHHNAMLWGRLGGIAAGVGAQVLASHSTGLVGKNRSLGGLDRWLLEFTDRVVALSATHARHLEDVEGVPAGKVVVIENGVDVDSFGGPHGDTGAREALEVRPDERVVLMVAALRPEKAHEAAVDAARILLDQGRRVRFLLAGEGPRREAVAARIRRAGVGGAVELLGLRTDVARLLSAADVLVLPSHDVVETLPLAVLEAMAAGVPVVASRVGSIPEIVEDGVSGLFVAPGDAVELARAIAYVLDEPERAAAMARVARERVRARYTVERMVRRYQDLFEALADGSST